MERIGRYEIVERLGAGGFATVYLARDPVLDSHVAIKVLAENWTDKSDLRERFIREAQLLRRIDSDRVITVHDIGELPSEQPYFVMSLVEGGTLDERLVNVGLPSTVALRNVGAQLAECLRVIHDQGMIHRDIKPSNLLIAGARSQATPPESGRVLRSSERLVLGDFGLAKDIALQSTIGFTISAGTGGYAAPEQMSPVGVPDQRTDIYAATGVIYRVATAQTPPSFDLASEVVPFPDHEPWMNGGLGQFFRHGMAFYSERRHESIEAWLADLRAAVDSMGNGASTSSANPTVAAGWAGDPVSPPPISSPSDPSTWAPPTVHTDPRQGAQRPLTDPRSVPSIGSPVVPNAGLPPAYQSPPANPGGSSAPGVFTGPQPGYPSEPAHTPAAHHFQPYPASQPLLERPSPVPGSAGIDYHSADPHHAADPYQEIRKPGGIGKWVALAAVVIAAIAGAVWYSVLRPVGPAVAGPDSIPAGETATYTATFDGAETFAWTDWNGETKRADDFDVITVAPGVLTFSVQAIGADGELSPATDHTITIDESPNGPQIEGPATVVVGQEQIYTFSAPEGSTSPEWIDGNGSRFGDTYKVTPRRAGTFRVVLIVTLANGDRIGTARVIEFVDP